jgi:hypothetical protein
MGAGDLDKEHPCRTAGVADVIGQGFEGRTDIGQDEQHIEAIRLPE